VRLSTATALQSSLNPSNHGQSVTLTATVTSTTGPPAGNVQFKLDGVNMGAPHALSGGVATYITTGLPTGSHNVTAVYLSSGTYVGSTSNTVTQVVN